MTRESIPPQSVRESARKLKVARVLAEQAILIVQRNLPKIEGKRESEAPPP